MRFIIFNPNNGYNISVDMVLNSHICRCAEKKKLWPMKLLDMWSEYVFIVILRELIIKCVIGFVRFVRILEDRWKWKKGTIIFNVLAAEDFCFRPMQLLDLVV